MRGLDEDAERAEQELLALARTPDGREVITYYFGKYTDTRNGVCPPAGLLMVQTVLRYEYPGR
jgi:hypothetical protein